MDTKFTPGPWVIAGHFIINEDNVDIAEIVPHNVHGRQIANAHLIAAAPDMYDVLRKVSEAIQYNLLDQYAAMYEIEKILAKARGEHV